MVTSHILSGVGLDEGLKTYSSKIKVLCVIFTSNQTICVVFLVLKQFHHCLNQLSGPSVNSELSLISSYQLTCHCYNIMPY